MIRPRLVKSFSFVSVLFAAHILVSCGGTGSSSTITSVTDLCSLTAIQSGQTSQCTANVQGVGNFSSAVAWKTSTGVVSSSGVFTAPTVTAATQAVIAATSVQDPTKSGTATIIVNPASSITSVVVSCNPNVLQLPIPNAAYPNSQCTAAVQGTGNFDSTVTWQSGLGTIGATSGVYIPPTVVVQTIATITATSTQDPTKSGSTTVTIDPSSANCPSGGQPAVFLSPPAVGASRLYGLACNVDTSKIKVVIYALTNQWYVQPFVDAPFTNIANDGSWTSSTFPWDVLVVLLVDPTNYIPAATSITNPALDPNVIAWTIYPPGPISVDFSNYVWGIKMTGTQPGYTFDPGPNHWSNDSSVISVTPDGRLHLKINQINGVWQCAELHLLKSLGYGIYTIQVDSHVDGLDQNTVAAPLFIYAAPGQELDNEYSGLGGLIPSPNNAQFVVQPYTVPGNIVRYVQPSTAQFTTQMEWRADHVTFTSWNGWANPPVPSDIIYQWTYTGANIPPVGNERVRINLWLLSGAAPTSGIGDSMIINSFSFQP